MIRKQKNQLVILVSMTGLLLCSVPHLQAQGLNLARYQPLSSSRAYQQDEAVDGIIHSASLWRSDSSTNSPWLEVDLQAPFSVRSAQVFTGTDSAAPCSNIRIDYWSGSSWLTCPGADLTGNTDSDLSIIFSNAVTASLFRLVLTGAGNQAYVREFALYPDNGGTGYPLGTDINLNLASHWGIDASSITASNFPRYAIDGYIHEDYQYLTDGSAGPHTLDTKMLWTQEVASVHVHTGAGAVSPLSDFGLYYWDGASWQACPGGSVTGNTDEHRIVNLSSNVMTSRIRLSFAGYGYIDEIVVLPDNGGANYPANTSVIFGAPPDKEWMVYEDAWYELVNKSNAKALTATSSGASQDDGAAADSEKRYQLLYNYDTRDYRIRNKASGDCLAVAGASRVAGSNIVEAAYHAAVHQRWMVEPLGGGYVRVVNQWSGLALETDDGDPAVVTQQALSTNLLQQWQAVYKAFYPKKGSAGSSNANVFNDSWNYGWTTDSSDLGINNVDHPMQWGEKTSEPHTDLHRDYAKWNSSSHPLLLLSYNEPTQASQANLTEAEGAEWFPVLAQMDLPLVGPSVMHAGGGTGEWHDVWFNQYMKPRGYDFEYLGYHVYRNANADLWINEIQEYSQLFEDKQVMVTEMNVAGWGAGTWTEEDMYNEWARFMYRAESLEFIHGYAAFTFNNKPYPSNSWEVGTWYGCMVMTNELTALGNLYKAWAADLVVHTNTSYMIHNLGCGSRLSNVDSDSVPDGLPIREEGSYTTQYHSTNTQWVLFNAPGGKYYIVSCVDGMRLSYNGTNVSLAAADTFGPDVEWTLTEYEYGEYYIESHVHNYDRLRLNRTSTSPLTYVLDVLPQSSTDKTVRFRFLRSVEPAAVPPETTPGYRSDTDPSQSKVIVPGVVQKGTWVTATILAADSSGVRHQSGGAGVWSVELNSLRANGYLAVSDNGDGSYTASYFASHNGTDILDIRLDGTNVGVGNPYTILVQDYPLPTLSTLEAVPMTTNEAVLGFILGVEDQADITLFWGDNDGGTVPGAWDNSVSLGSQSSGNHAYTLAALSETNVYYYTCRAVHPHGTIWGDSQTFVTARFYNELLDTVDVNYNASTWTDGLPTSDDHLLSNGGGRLEVDWDTLVGTSFTINNHLTRFRSEGGNYTPGWIRIGGPAGIMWNGSTSLWTSFDAWGSATGNTLFVESFAFHNNNTGANPVIFRTGSDDIIYLQLDNIGAGNDIVFNGKVGSSGYRMTGEVHVKNSVRSIGTGDGFDGVFDVQTTGSLAPSDSIFVRDGTIDINTNHVIGDEVAISLEDGAGGDAVFDISGATDNVGDLRGKGSGGVLAVDAATSFVFSDYNEGPVAVSGFVQGSTVIQFDGVMGDESLANMTINSGPATWSDLGGGIYQLASTTNWPPAVTGVVISGTAAIGRTLSGRYSYSDFESDPDVSTVQWYRSTDGVFDTNDTAIAGATGADYLIQSEDIGAYLFFDVTPRASAGTTPGMRIRSVPSDRIAGDSDSDGMDDDWELINGFNANNPSDAAVDADGDGSSNVEEYYAGTIPTNMASVLKISGIYAEGGGLRIDWHGGTQARQYIEYSTGLMGTNEWVAIYTNHPATAVTNSLSGLTNLPSQLYYRIRAERP